MTLLADPPHAEAPPPEVPLAPAPAAAEPSPRVGAGFLAIAGAASIAAGAIHAGAISGHADHKQAVWAFLFVTVVQIAWGGLALGRPRRWVAWLGIATGTAFAIAWIVAKTRGLPLISGLDTVEPVQGVDAVAAGLAAVTALASLVSLAPKKFVLPSRVAVVACVALLLIAAPGVPAAVNHTHNHATTVATEPAPAVPPHPFDPNLPIDLSGVPGVSPQEQARAENLLAASVRGLPQWADPAYDEAHGFFSIGDGVTGTEHYLNLEYIEDNVMLDPDKPESLVFDVDRKTGQKHLAAAMYMATPGMTLSQVPDIGGPLTQWHIHNNLCFTPAGKVGGLTKPDGTCTAGLTKGAEIPMIHVWIEPHKCGPFAALEGIGGGQILPGETVACDHVHEH